MLVADGQAGQVYELGGDSAFTLAEYAALLGAESGSEVVYRDLPADELTAVLTGAGLPEAYAAILTDSDLGLARGELLADTGDLSRLIGRPTTSPVEAIRAALG